MKLRMTLPHIVLIVFLCCYIVSGAYVLYSIEHPTEVRLKIEGLKSIQEFQRHFEETIVKETSLKIDTDNELITLGNSSDKDNVSEFQQLFRQALHNYTKMAISVVKTNYLEHYQLVGDENVFANGDLWTLSSAILFSFSIITTIVYRVSIFSWHFYIRRVCAGTTFVQVFSLPVQCGEPFGFTAKLRGPQHFTGSETTCAYVASSEHAPTVEVPAENRYPNEFEVTFIGWGNISPVTFYGKLFCILYGLIGIPFAMLVIANIGKFLSEAFNWVLTTRKRCWRLIKMKIDDLKNRNKINENLNNQTNINNSNLQSQSTVTSSVEAIDKPLSFLWVLLIIFGYLIAGGLLLPIWENLSFFDAFYFAFVSITTTGFGDIVPANHKYLALTLSYIAVGVAFTTIGVELAAGYMRKLHYVGRKIKGAKFAMVRFGGQEINMNDLLNVLGKKYHIPKADLHKLTDNFDDFIENALNINAGGDNDEDEENLVGNGDLIRRGSYDVRNGNWMENWLNDLNNSQLNKGAFTISDDDIRFIDDDRLVSNV